MASSAPAAEAHVPAGASGFARILCAVDFSHVSHQALELAAQIAARDGAELVVLHVFVPPPTPFEGWRAPTSQSADVETRLLASVEPLLARVNARGGSARAELRPGDPRQEIVEVASRMQADLIVVGTHGRAGLDRWLLGSTAESVLRAAPCPVLTVSPRATGCQALKQR